jgi:S1-C subfamily serine protease
MKSARSSFALALIAALLGGGVVAGALYATGAAGTGPTTTLFEQSPVASSQSASASASRAEAGLTAHDIYMRDAPGVAYIRSQIVQQVDSPFGLSPQSQQSEATGTGFVIDTSGHILTNYHVVAGASDVTVTLGNASPTRATVLGTDPSNDLALLKIDPSGQQLKPLQLGDSKTAQVGDPVLAIGNPFGLDRTLTTGVVSALARQIQAPNGFTIDHVIQTDASINPGNSGGPLIDASGRVIGITSQIETGGSGSNGNIGIGFAVPIDTAKLLLPQLKKSGQLAHAYLGITGVTIDSSFQALQLRASRGILLQTVEPGSGAAKAGLRGGTVQSQVNGQQVMLGGDVVQTLDGKPVTSMSALSGMIATRKPGNTVRLGILRDGQTKQVVVTLGTAPKTAPGASQSSQSP